MIFERIIRLDNLKRSAFLFGPRMSGKTFLLKSLKSDLYFDLIDPVLELEFKRNPGLFWQQISALKTNSTVIIDEIQKVPPLLDYVQKGIEEKNLLFILSGSSARKLRRGGANLLGGRAKDLKLHPLTSDEIGKYFNLQHACQYGTIPKVVQYLTDNEKDEARSLLQSYTTTYIKEEIQSEAITRNIGAFQRFLNVAAQDNAQIVEFANISRECSVPMSTVKEYYSILEDTLIGNFLWPWDRSERKKARPKFYFFDCGVVRSIQNRLFDPPTSNEMGFLFETWFIQEIRRFRDYYNKQHELTFWREGNNEIDLLILHGSKPVLAIECKSGRQDINMQTVAAFQNKFPKTQLIIASLNEKNNRILPNGIEIIPWGQVIHKYINM